MALTENQGDLDFVISIARQIIDTGTFAIICDITRSLKVGDIVVRMPGGEIEVVECKNFRSKKSLTSVGGRVGRQIRRGKWLSEYLTRGIAVGTNAEALHLPKGMETEQMAVGVDVEEEYDWSLLTDAVGQAFATGFGAAANNHSFVFATRPGVTPPTDVVFPEPPDPGQSALLVSIGRDFFEMPAIHRPITLWELPLEHVLSIFEGDISLAHGVSVQEFCGACPDGSEWEIHSIDPSGSMHCRRSGGEDIVLTSNFVNRSRYEFQT
ncbi:hypothetical protein, partial [Parafrankia sp. FMc2]|uniref:hypothetical protein n=1 Tax=Parafrankia sp. FMc2 TaxID=3233196 RepID=UPI0034D42CDA